MDKDGYDEGVPSWVDLSSSDPDAAAAFYAALLGWDTPEGAPEFGGYRVCTLNGRSVAGIAGQMEAGPSAWMTYINTSSVDDTLARATAAGAKTLMAPMDVGGNGRMAVLADPTGAVIGLWQPASHIGAQMVNEVGAWCWSELLATDVDDAIRFYPAAFGWGTKPSPPDGPLQYMEWTVGGAPVAGMMPQPADMPPGTPPFWGPYFVVADTDAALAKVTELGGQKYMGPMDIEIGRFAVCADPTGAVFNIIALAAG